MQDERKRNRWFASYIFSSSVYLIWRIFFTIPWSAGSFQAAAGIVLVLAETVTTLGVAELMIGRMKSAGCEIALPDVPPERFPDVDVFIATHNADFCTRRSMPVPFWSIRTETRYTYTSATTETEGRSGSWRNTWEPGIWDFPKTGMPSRETITMPLPIRRRRSSRHLTRT